MRTPFLIIVLALLLFGSFNQCKKPEVTPVNVTLYDKTPNEILQYIHGKWELVYESGGFSGSAKYYIDKGVIIEFTLDNRVLIPNLKYVGTYTLNEPIVWERAIWGYAGYNDSTNIMTYSSQGYVMDKIYNDTLIFHDYASDAVYHHYIKAK